MQSDEYKELKEELNTLRECLDIKYGELLKQTYEKYNEINKLLTNHFQHISADISLINTKIEYTEKWKEDFSCQMEKFKFGMMNEIKDLMLSNSSEDKKTLRHDVQIEWMDKLIWIVLGLILMIVINKVGINLLN